ncbi:MAG: NUDIX hydrolase [Gammaproteobacteria bacterium]|nr:NUDIX hydrolase [Gammaproteobacteria bacterium]
MPRKTYPTEPRVAVGAVVIWKDRVLLVKRRDPPNEGQWAIPGGSVRLGETLQEAAERELHEETGIRIRAGRPVYIFDVIQRDPEGRIEYHYVITDLWSEYLGGEPMPRDDALDARWFTPADMESVPVNAMTRDLLDTTLGFGRSPGTADAPDRAP